MDKRSSFIWSYCMSSFNREKIKEILMPIVMQAYETKDSNLDIRKMLPKQRRECNES